MADLGISIAEKLIEVIGSEVIRKICEMWNYQSELEDLKNTINIIKNILVEADSIRDLNLTDQAYIDELKVVVYDADDLFDEFYTLAELNQLNTAIDGKRKNKLVKKVRDFFSSKKKGVTEAHRMSQLVKETKERLDSIANKHKKFELKLDKKPTTEMRETSSRLDKNIVLGREDDQRKVIGMLLSPDIEDDVHFLTIVGFGGLGKTTLAKLVFHDKVIQEKFSYPAVKLWVCVSDQDGQQFDIKDILCKILEVHLGHKEFDNKCSLELVRSKFEEILGGKKYFIVLDDVWNEDDIIWRDLKSMLMLGQRGSRILITTRSKRTCTIVGESVYNLDGLSPNDSWSLFEILAFGKERKHKDHDEFVQLGNKIVKKCHNVPLAIVVMGSLLKGQKINKWRSLEEIGMNEIGKGDNQIMSILKLSYHNLNFSAKRCFSYCALFSKDTKIKKEMLISLWMAQGYIVPCDEGCQSLEFAAEEVFDTLLERCFFQVAEQDEYGDVTEIIIHDLMHDVAQDVGKQEICVLNSKSSRILGDKIRHLNIECYERLEELTIKSKIRSYINAIAPKIHSQIIESVMCLRVLDLNDSAGLNILPDWIGKLIHLRYLNLSWIGVKTLPNSITELHNLQTLMLRDCVLLKKLPKEFGKLVNLRQLDVEGAVIERMPSGMEKLSNMRVLPYFVVGNSDEEPCDGILEALKSFTNIKGSIHIEFGPNYRSVGGMNEAEEGYLKSTKYLTSLEVLFYPSGTSTELDQEDTMAKLEPNSNLKEFSLYHYKGRIIPRWGTTQSNWAISFPHLVKITVHHCSNLEHLPTLSKLRYLNSLVLRGLKLEYMEDASDIITQGDQDHFPTSLLFPSLESLEIEYMSRLKGWWRGEDDEGHIWNRRLILFPSLSYLRISDCPSLKSLLWLFPIQTNFKLSENNNGNRPPEIIDLQEEEEEEEEIKVRGLEKLEIDNADYIKSMFVSCQSSKCISKDDSHIPGKSLVNHNQSLCYLRLEWLEDVHLPIAANHAHLLTSLHTLYFDMCKNLEALPEWIGNLSSLQHLIIEDCHKIKSLPKSMSKLTSLQSLRIQTINSDFLE